MVIEQRLLLLSSEYPYSVLGREVNRGITLSEHGKETRPFDPSLCKDLFHFR